MILKRSKPFLLVTTPTKARNDSKKVFSTAPVGVVTNRYRKVCMELKLSIFVGDNTNKGNYHPKTKTAMSIKTHRCYIL
jgi:hypothetical protein